MRASSVAAALLSVCLATGCSSQFDRRFEEAESLRAEAAASGAEWIGTQDLLDEARDLHANGDTEAALALVEEARFQADAAIRQSNHEAEAWKTRVIR